MSVDMSPDATPDLMKNGDHPPQAVYACAEDWVNDYFVPMFRRTLGGEFRWCAQWWRHAEAISRLTALWHAWEVLRLQPGTGMGSWYRDYLDHQLPVLLGARGPFYQCSEESHREPHEPVTEPAPEGWWDTDEITPDIAPEGDADGQPRHG
jgi:uncharacterized protein DUF4913